MEFTNAETFCLSCHEMQSNVCEEPSRTVHFSNRSSVRAICSDCHMPHSWTNKIARKMQASKGVWGHLFGTISTRQRFLDRRLELAEHEWARVAANDSLECRNCQAARDESDEAEPSCRADPSTRSVHRSADLYRLRQGHCARTAGYSRCATRLA